MQPTFIPWIGYFDMIDKVDSFVFLDHVQLVKRSWQVRNKIIFNNKEKFITVPILKEAIRNETYINTANIDYSSNWDSKFVEYLKMSYRDYYHFDKVMGLLINILEKKIKNLAELNILIIETIANKIGISTTLLRSSSLNPKGKKDEMLVNILKSLNCSNYLSAFGSHEYIEKDTLGGEFAKNNIELVYHNYDHPIYKQNNDLFQSHLGIIDLLFCEGLEKSLNIIRSGRQNNLTSLDVRNIKKNNYDEK